MIHLLLSASCFCLTCCFLTFPPFPLEPLLLLLEPTRVLAHPGALCAGCFCLRQAASNVLERLGGRLLKAGYASLTSLNSRLDPLLELLTDAALPNEVRT